MNNKNQNEPIAFVTGVFGGRFIVEPTNPAMVLPVNIALYTHPQPRKPLTDEQTIIDVLNKHFECVDDEYIKRAAKEIAAHGIKE